MKRIYYIFIIGAFLSLANLAIGQQRISYVDSEYILEQMPEYRSAQKQLDDAADKWKQEIQKRKAELDKLIKSYNAEYILLPEETRKKREEEIQQKQKEHDEFIKDKFAPDGELFKRRQQLIKPIQDKVYDAIQKVAKENAQDFIFDKAGAVTILYTNPKYDRSDEVLEKLGVTGKDNGTEPAPANQNPSNSNPNSNQPNSGFPQPGQTPPGNNNPSNNPNRQQEQFNPMQRTPDGGVPTEQSPRK